MPNLQQSFGLSIKQLSRYSRRSDDPIRLSLCASQRGPGNYLKTTFKLSTKVATDASDEIISRTLVQRFLRALFGVDPSFAHFDEETLHPDRDLRPILKAVADVLDSLN